MKNTPKNTYWQNIYQGIKTSWEGLSISIKHIFNATKRHKPTYINAKDYFDLKNGLVTLQYPHEKIPLPDQARYQLHNEMDDCIVCDKCVKICPVDCIEIDSIKATEQVGVTSDGSPIRLYASKFDIDLAKCCYCGLCTTVCPTDCLTMTQEFDVSTYNTGELLAHFATLTPQEAQEKLDLLVIFQKEKALSKNVKPHVTTEKIEELKQQNEIKEEIIEKPKFIPKMKPKTTIIEKLEQPKEETKQETLSLENPPLVVEGLEKPKFIPKMKPKINIAKNTDETKE
jgi:formate hydrogenlyase subunit 6/NADH:ubiquinone oxidoreductase subunit I